MLRPRRAIVSFATLLALLTSCHEQPPSEPNALTDVVERGPFRLSVKVTPAKLWVGDPLTIELRVHTPDDYVVQFPTGEDLGEFQARSVKTVDPRPAPESGLDWQQTIRAETFRSGVVELPALVAKYAPQPIEPEAEPLFEHQLASRALEVELRSALTTQESVFEPRDITGTLTPPGEPLSPWTVVLVAGLIVLAIVLVVLLVLWLERRAKRPLPPILPEVWALRALAELWAADLIGSGRAKEFYYRLSEIVRVYIERRFGLAAPEMTTEEFLGTLARHRGALPYDAERLRDFLEACDLVKYAAFTPLQQDAEQALGTARAFVDATAAATQRPSTRSASGGERERGEYAA